MEAPLQITFRDVPSSPAVEASIREHAAELAQFYGRSCAAASSSSCRIVISGRATCTPCASSSRCPGTRSSSAASRRRIRPTRTSTSRSVTRSMRRGASCRITRGATVGHQAPRAGRRRPRGTPLPRGGYGFIETRDGREVYFHRNSVVDGKFDALSAGVRVRFAEERGEKGPQATVVHPGRHGGAESTTRGRARDRSARRHARRWSSGSSSARGIRDAARARRHARRAARGVRRRASSPSSPTRTRRCRSRPGRRSRSRTSSRS